MTPNTISELSDVLREGNIDGGTFEKISLTKLDRVVRHTPQDLTITVETGATLASLQSHLGKVGQWLPLDPPGAGTLTIQTVLDHDLSGPRRFGFGTARDWIIGVKAVLNDGRIVESGGNVVKNVAGYDIHKLLIGAHGELAIITEVTFKVNPLPEKEEFFTANIDDFGTAKQLLQELMMGPLNFHVLDIHTMGPGGLSVAVGFHGSPKEVDWQSVQLPSSTEWEPADLRYSDEFFGRNQTANIMRSSVVPSKLLDTLEALSETQFVARAGNGVIYRVGKNLARAEVSLVENRIKDLFGLSSRVDEKIEGIE